MTSQKRAISSAARKKSGKRLTPERLEKMRRLHDIKDDAGENVVADRWIASSMEVSQSGVTWTKNGKRHADKPRLPEVPVTGGVVAADIGELREALRLEGGVLLTDIRPDPALGFRKRPMRKVVIGPGMRVVADGEVVVIGTAPAADDADVRGVVTLPGGEDQTSTGADDVDATKGAA